MHKDAFDWSQQHPSDCEDLKFLGACCFSTLRILGLPVLANYFESAVEKGEIDHKFLAEQNMRRLILSGTCVGPWSLLKDAGHVVMTHTAYAMKYLDMQKETNLGRAFHEAVAGARDKPLMLEDRSSREPNRSRSPQSRSPRSRSPRSRSPREAWVDETPTQDDACHK